MKLRLTDMAIKKLSYPTTGQVTYWDETTPGFGMRCSKKSKSFVVMYGERRQLKTLGRYPHMSLADARKSARAFQVYVSSNPTIEHISITFNEARTAFLEHCQTKNKPRTVNDYTRLLNKHFQFECELRELSRNKIMSAVSKLAKTPSEQDHAYVAIRTFMNWCVSQGYIKASPVPKLRHHREERTRILSDKELAAVYNEALSDPYPFGPIVQMLVLTGQRRGEIASLRRSWITEDTVTFPSEATKNKREHRLPLTSTTKELITSLPDTGDVLFSGRNDFEKPFNGWGKCKKRFDLNCGVKDYTLHDLRRTFSSNMARFGVPIQVTEKILNHVSGSVSGVAAIYNRHSYFDEMRDALNMYSQFLAKISNK